MTPVDMAGPRTWKVLLAAAAEADFRDIIRWTAEEFGDAQARVYAETLSAAIELYRAMDMTFWLPQAEAALAQVEGQ